MFYKSVISISPVSQYQSHRTEHPAASFGARGTPGKNLLAFKKKKFIDTSCVVQAVFKLNEIMGIEQNRAWGVCSLNDFRKVCDSVLSIQKIREANAYLFQSFWVSKVRST